MKPKMFIGSSSEQLRLAYALQRNLQYSIATQVWTQGIFELSKTSLASLLEAVNYNEFATFIFHPDDIVHLRNKKLPVVRDNVIFELGLFVGKLGPEKTYIVTPREVPLHLPTDLLGFTPATFDAEQAREKPDAAMGAASSQIQESVQRYNGDIKTNFLTGDWHQCWNVRSKFFNKRNPSRAPVQHQGNQFASRIQTAKQTFDVNGMIKNNIITGTWSDTVPGVSYHGAFQLKIHPGRDRLSGKWIGFAENGKVKTGSWDWNRSIPAAGKSKKTRVKETSKKG